MAKYNRDLPFRDCRLSRMPKHEELHFPQIRRFRHESRQRLTGEMPNPTMRNWPRTRELTRESQTRRLIHREARLADQPARVAHLVEALQAAREVAPIER